MTDAAAATPTPTAMDVDAAAAPVSPLEAAFATVAATNPDAAKVLEKRLIEITKLNEKQKQTIEDQRKKSGVDARILQRELKHLQTFMSPETRDLFDVNYEQLTDANPAMVTNAAHRLVAACNAEFMARGAQPPAKRVRVAAEPAAAAAPPPAPASASEVRDSSYLRNALAATYGL